MDGILENPDKMEVDHRLQILTNIIVNVAGKHVIIARKQMAFTGNLFSFIKKITDQKWNGQLTFPMEETDQPLFTLIVMFQGNKS